MNANLLSESMLDILTAVNRWEIFCSAFEPALYPVDNAKHKEWMDTNSHAHSYPEVLFVMSGEGYFGYRGDCYPIIPGSVFILNSSEEHDNLYPQWASEFDHLWLHFVQDSILTGIVSARGNAVTTTNQSVISEKTIPWTHSLFDYTNHSHLPTGLRRLRIYSAISILISTFIQSGLPERHIGDQSSFQKQIVTAIEQHIQQTYGKGLNLDALAVISGYSKFHFERLFKQHTGRSVHQYINECRTAKVTQMIGDGYSKKEIASVLGFSRQSAFSRWLCNSRNTTEH